jgi:hypothetical protein
VCVGGGEAHRQQVTMGLLLAWLHTTAASPGDAGVSGTTSYSGSNHW